LEKEGGEVKEREKRETADRLGSFHVVSENMKREGEREKKKGKEGGDSTSGQFRSKLPISRLSSARNSKRRGGRSSEEKRG